MKTLTLRSFLVGFFFGALVFAGLFYIIRNSRPLHPSTDSEIKIIDREAALTLRNNFTVNYPDRLQAINVSILQVHAIKKALSEMNADDSKSIEGFRLYFASENLNTVDTISSLVYPIYETEQQVRSSQVYMVSGIKGQYSLPCPPFCDVVKSK